MRGVPSKKGIIDNSQNKLTHKSVSVEGGLLPCLASGRIVKVPRKRTTGATNTAWGAQAACVTMLLESLTVKKQGAY